MLEHVDGVVKTSPLFNMLKAVRQKSNNQQALLSHKGLNVMFWSLDHKLVPKCIFRSSPWNQHSSLNIKMQEKFG